MALRTNLTVIQAIEVVRTDQFTMTASAHGIHAEEQDAIARYVAFNAPDGKIDFEQCGYKWRSCAWRDTLSIHYLEEPSKRINLLCIDSNKHPHGPSWLKKFLGPFAEKLLIAGLVEGAKKGINGSYRYWDTNENRIRADIFSFAPHAVERSTSLITTEYLTFGLNYEILVTSSSPTGPTRARKPDVRVRSGRCFDRFDKGWNFAWGCCASSALPTEHARSSTGQATTTTSAACQELRGDESAESQFYDEYNAVLDMPTAYYYVKAVRLTTMAREKKEATEAVSTSH